MPASRLASIDDLEGTQAPFAFDLFRLIVEFFMPSCFSLKDHGDAVMGVCFSQHARTLASVPLDLALKDFSGKFKTPMVKNS